MHFAGRGGGVTRPRGGSPRLLDVVRERMRVRHYSLRTEQACIGWIRRFIIANGRRHPRELGGPEIEAFLTRLVTELNVAAGTQNHGQKREGRFADCSDSPSPASWSRRRWSRPSVSHGGSRPAGRALPCWMASAATLRRRDCAAC